MRRLLPSLILITAGLLLEALNALAVWAHVARQDLYRYLAAKAGIASTIDLAHSTGAQRRQNLVGAKFQAGRKRGLPPVR